MSLPRPLKAVVFDMDGLLIDSEQLVFRAMQETAISMGGEMPFEVFQRMVGLQHVESDLIALEHFGPQFDLEAWRVGVRAYFHDEAAAEVALKEGVVELLDHLDVARLPRAVATSSGRDAVERHLGHHGLLDRFDAILARGDYPAPKPNPDPFLAAAKALGVLPQDCLALEDSHNGVRAAAGAGMMTIMVPDMLEPTEEMHTLCLRIARDLHEVRELLRGRASAQ
jgi:HAD superfamily hydrolase (TIGR01509 family)